VWEIVSAVAAAATTVIIAVTAIVAVHQIRQLRVSTQLEGLLAMHSEYTAAEMNAAREFIVTELSEKLKDPTYRKEIIDGHATSLTHPEFVVANFWEKVGMLVGEGVLDPKLYLVPFAYRCIEAWEQLKPVIELRRIKEPLQWKPFDHMVALSRDYLLEYGPQFGDDHREALR